MAGDYYLYQPVAVSEGVSMGWPPKVRRGSLFSSRYLAKKWVEETDFSRYGSVTIFKIQVHTSRPDGGFNG